jgi:hypothetical protein
MKTSRTKYSKTNKGFKTLIDNNSNDKFKAYYAYMSTVGNITDKILLNSIKSFSKNGYENIFIETEGLYDFLKDTKIITHGDISAQIYEAIKNRKFTQLDKINTVDGIRELRTYNFMVYAPINMINTALAITLFVTDKQENIKMNNENGQDTINYSANSLCWTGKEDFGTVDIALTEMAFSKKNKEGWLKKDLENFHVILNMLFYMNAFPDYVYEGVPKRAVLDEKTFHKNRITINPNPDFFEKIEKSPHLRRGHFRTYSSNYFTNMKGKTAFIEPTFVKGKSITVEDGISI